MTKIKKNKIIAKPFVKWAGGKGSLIDSLVDCLPNDLKEHQDVTYIEPFVGGGAMLFYMLTHYPNIKRAIINDVNEDLINCYLLIKNDPLRLITLLRNIRDEYYQLTSIDDKSSYYYHMREKYNNEKLSLEERSACFIFLNKTCFNGLFRLNQKGESGCRTVFDIPPAMLSIKPYEELIKEML